MIYHQKVTTPPHYWLTLHIVGVSYAALTSIYLGKEIRKKLQNNADNLWIPSKMQISTKVDKNFVKRILSSLCDLSSIRCCCCPPSPFQEVITNHKSHILHLITVKIYSSWQTWNYPHAAPVLLANARKTETNPCLHFVEINIKPFLQFTIANWNERIPVLHMVI